MGQLQYYIILCLIFLCSTAEAQNIRIINQGQHPYRHKVGELSTSNSSLSGALTVGGTEERVSGTNSYIDFDDSGAGTVTLSGLAGTNNEKIIFDLETTVDVCRLTGVSSTIWDGDFIIQEEGDARTFTITDDDPHNRIYSADQNNDNDYIEMYHNQDDGYIKVGTGDINLDSADDIILDTSSGKFLMKKEGSFSTGFFTDFNKDEYRITTHDNVGNMYIFTNDNALSQDHDHAIQTNPTIFLHSDTEPDTDNTQWLGLYHNQTDAVVETGTGDLILTPLTSQVGIGITPDVPLEVIKSDNTPQLRLTHTDGMDDVDFTVDENGDFTVQASGNGVYFKNDADSTEGFVVQDSGGNRIFLIDTSNKETGLDVANPAALFDVGGGSPDSIDGTDDVLIADDIEVDGDTYLEGTFKNQNATDSTTSFQVLDADGGNPVLNLDTTNERVGIGTDAPGSPLHVSSGVSTGAWVYIDSTGTSGDNWRIVSTASGIGAIGGGHLVFNNEDAGKSVLTLRNDGKVGINDSTPTYELDAVVADARFTGNMFVEGTSFGVGTNSPAEEFEFRKNQAAATALLVRNTSTSTSARTRIALQNDSGIGYPFSLMPSTHGTYPSRLFINNDVADADLSLGTHESGPVRTDHIQLDGDTRNTILHPTDDPSSDAGNEGNVIFGDSNIGTNAELVFGHYSGTAPTSSPANMYQFWSADRGGTAGKASMHLRIEDGTLHVFGDQSGFNTQTPGYTLEVNGTLQADDYYSGDGSQGITDNTSYWFCTAADCSSTCQVTIKDGLITGCP